MIHSKEIKKEHEEDKEEKHKKTSADETSCEVKFNPDEDPAEKAQAEKSMNITFFVAVATIIVLVAGILLYRHFSSSTPAPETLEYNHFSFAKIAGTWYSQWVYGNQPYQIALSYNPYELDNVTVTGAISPEFDSKNITYITTELPDDIAIPYVGIALSEIGINFKRVLGMEFKFACTSNETRACSNMTIAQCGDNDKAVIYVKNINEKGAEGNAAMILNNTCITIQGNGKEIVRAAERMLYKLYRIMP